MTKNIAYYLLLSFTLLSCFGKGDNSLNRADQKLSKFTNSNCDSSVASIIQSFPLNYFSKAPQIINLQEDIVQITIWEKWKVPHTVNYSEVLSRMVHVLDSLKCFQVEEKLGTNRLKVIIYYENDSDDNRIVGYASGTDLLERWTNESYRKFNELILNTNPSYFWRFDYFLEAYFENYNNPIFDTDFQTIYESIIGMRRYKKSDDQIIDSLVSASEFNSNFIDPNIIEDIKSLSPLMLGKNKELVITDQITDSIEKPSK